MPNTREKLMRLLCAANSKATEAEAAEDYAKGKPVWFWDVTNVIDYCSTKGYKVRSVAEFGMKRAPQSWCYVEGFENA